MTKKNILPKSVAPNQPYKEKTLSSERKELFNVIENLEYAEFNDVNSRIDKIQHIKNLITSQDNQFIKEVLEEIDGIKTATYNWKFLDRAKEIIKQKAGGKLI